MRLLLLFLLQFSLALCLDPSKTLGKDELYLDLSGFPAGSLLTFYFKTKTQSNPTTGIPNEIAIDLYESFQEASSANLHFRLNLKDNTLLSDYRPTSVGESGWTKQVVCKPWLTDDTPTQGERWMRFDLYRIDDTKFLVFFQGFLADFAQNPRELIVKKSITSVHIKPHGNQALNFYMENVYISIKNPSKNRAKPDTVFAALNQAKVVAARGKRVVLTTLKDKEKFLVGTTIALSALMVSPETENHLNYASFFFYNKQETWAFEIMNKWLGDNGFRRVDSYLSIVKKDEDNEDYWIRAINKQTCTGALHETTSTDIVHLKLTRLKNKIEMRSYYRDDKHSGFVCTLALTDEEEGYLDGEITIKGSDSATILHMTIE